MPLTLWLTDRTRYTTGTGRCRRQRYLTNHFGPTGYGMVRKAESLPLATGIYTHQALEILYRHLQETDTFPDVPLVRHACQTACAAYEARIAERGFRGLLQSEKTDAVVVEQQALLTGLIWAMCRTVLPWIHQTFRLLEVESESLYILDCTCGLGSAVVDGAAHDARGCHGIALQLRQDALGARRDDGRLAYLESKTTGWAGDTWASGWETRPQLPLGTLGIKERYGHPVEECYIIGLYKGARKGAEDAWGQEIVRQDSVFAYGYCRPTNPPLAPDDWVPSYEWIDEMTGEQRRKSRAHVKRGVWELEGSDWPIWLASKQADPSLQPSEFWATWLPLETVKKSIFVVGPMLPSAFQVERLQRQIVGEERSWQQALWALYELQQQGYGWATEVFQAKLDELVPASWDCQRFGRKYGCEFIPVCFGYPEWEDPLATGKWVPRVPHHEAELAQAVGRGLLPEQGAREEEEE